MDVTEPHHEPSYYEIALTNRQVVVAFVILLACLLAAFFSGVWIGRGGIEPRRDQVVRATPPQPPAEGQTLEELKFFADRPAKKGAKPEEKPAEPKTEEIAAVPAPSPAPAPKPPETTLQQDLGTSRSRPSPPPSNSVVRSTPPAPAPAPEEVAEPARPEPVQTRPAPADHNARGKTPASAPAPDTSTESAQPGAGSVVVQVFASADPAEAQRVRERLVKGGQTAFLSPLTVDGHTMYRVRIGPFGTRQKAQKVAEKVRKTFKLDTWLTE
ncbi:MAG TPA: SPOR domain-containing protein [Thermoanaerobaculia bacterium]|nr:SPOR domain-containing protein [Thermoanaerobaculia bacterium]